MWVPTQKNFGCRQSTCRFRFFGHSPHPEKVEVSTVVDTWTVWPCTRMGTFCYFSFVLSVPSYLTYFSPLWIHFSRSLASECLVTRCCCNNRKRISSTHKNLLLIGKSILLLYATICLLANNLVSIVVNENSLYLHIQLEKFNFKNASK